MSETVVIVDGKEFDVVKTGIAQAEQVLDIGRWLAKFGGPVFDAAKDEDEEIKVEDITGIFDMVGRALNVLTPEALVDLFALAIGCSKKFSREQFDIAILIEALQIIWDQQPAFRRVVERFFSSQDSSEQKESNSTLSEEPTGGATTLS